MFAPHTKKKCKTITSFVSSLQFVQRNRTDRLVAATQVAERHSGVQHMEQRNLWKTGRFMGVNQLVSSAFALLH